jgi:hypothetical protein
MPCLTASLFHAFLCVDLRNAHSMGMAVRVPATASTRTTKTLNHTYSSLQGHGFARPCNRVDFYYRAEKFLAQHCGGRVGDAEPDQTVGHSASVIDPATCKAA